MIDKSFLFILSRSPYAGFHANEAIDAVLASAAYDADVSVLFLDDGVFQLLGPQNLETLPHKNVAKKLSALTMYGVDKVYVSETALLQRGIEQDALCIPCTTVPDSDIRPMLDQHDVLINF